MSSRTTIFDDCFDVIRDFSYEHGMFTGRDDVINKSHGPRKTFIWGSPFQKRIIIDGSNWNGTFKIVVEARLYNDGLRSMKSESTHEELSADNLKENLRCYLDSALDIVNSWTESDLSPSEHTGF